MKSLAAVLMGYLALIIMLVHLMPIPFLGNAAGLLLYPFSRLIGWQDLFKVCLFQFCFIYTLQFDQVISIASLMNTMSIQFSAPLDSFWFYPLFGFCIIAGALFQTAMLKLIGVHVHPKMLRRLGL
jgi:hypothetical protein